MRVPVPRGGSCSRLSKRAFADARAPLRRSVMSPELRLGADSSISTVTSITDVIVTGDLQIAKIYVSFFGARVAHQLSTLLR